jgi:hypothetical protein
MTHLSIHAIEDEKRLCIEVATLYIYIQYIKLIGIMVILYVYDLDLWHRKVFLLCSALRGNMSTCYSVLTTGIRPLICEACNLN